MNKSLRKFLALLGFASLVTTNGLVLAGSPEAWLSPVCYHDSLEFGNYRWNCLLPPPPVPDDRPSSYELAQETISSTAEPIAMPEFAVIPDEGTPPFPQADISVGTVSVAEPYDCEMMLEEEVFVAPSCDQEVEPPAYFSATDIRRRDWWTPPFILRPQPPVTPFAIDFDCRTQWNMDQSPVAEDRFESTDVADIPADCVQELVADQWSEVEAAFDAVRSIDSQMIADNSARLLTMIAPYVANSPAETGLNDSGFTAFTYTIPYTLTASTTESADLYHYDAVNDEMEQVAADKATQGGNQAEIAEELQKLARQLDWVGLNILRVADHLDSWANQAILRQNMDAVR
jgi:hypothetical protein